MYLAISLFCKIGINLFVIFYLAKKLNLIDFGSFSLAFVFSSFLVAILDYGFNLKGLTLAGKDLSKINQHLSKMLSAKIVVTIFSLTIFFIFLLNNNYNKVTRTTIIILGLSSIPISFGNFFVNSFKIFHNYKKEAIGFVIQALIILFLIILNEFYGENNIIYYASFIAVSRIIYLLYSIIVFNNTFLLSLEISLKEIFKTLKENTPYAVHLVLSSSIIYIDTFILSLLSSLQDVGLYQAGIRIVMAAMLIAVILNDAFIPEISSLASNKKKVIKKLQNLFKFVLFFAIITSVIILNFKNTIITILFSEKYLTLNSYIYYIVSIVFLRYIGVVPGIILTSFNNQKTRAIAVVVSIITSVLLNWFLIPVFGVEGAFISSLLAHIILNIIYVSKSLDIIRYIKRDRDYFMILSITILNIVFIKLYVKDNLLGLFFVCLFNLTLILLILKKKQTSIKFLNKS